MHHIQKKIIESLTLAESLKYSQMRPARVESNQFAYHLKQLIKNSMVEKRGSSYTLSAKGLAYVDKLSLQNFNTRGQPKIVTLLDIVEPGGETVLLKRQRQPYFGKLLLPTGKIHMSESMDAAAKRECEEKLGFKNVKLEHRGVVMVGAKRGDTLISQILAHVYHGKTTKQEIKTTARGVNCFWSKIDSHKDQDYLEGLKEIKNFLAKEKEFFYKEIWFEV